VNFSVGFKTDIGRVREVNEDSFAVFRRQELADELDALLVIADGMGGGRAGDVASRIVAETVPETVQEFLFEQSGSRGKHSVGRILSDAIERANARIWMQQAEKRELRGMGTTCVAAALHDGRITIAHAGDSRAYLLRDGQLRQVTDDHSEVWQQVLAGSLTREEAARSKFRNSIIKAVGLSQSKVDADVETHALQDGDTIMLCTDGLNIELNDPEIATILAAAPTAQDACDRLVDAAVRKGGSDNVTVVTLRYGKFAPLATASVMHDTLPRIPEEDETVTDPEPVWREPERVERRPSPSRPRAAAVVHEDDEEAEDEEESSSRGRQSRDGYAERERQGGGSSMAAALISVLLLVVIAEAIGLALLSSNRKVTAAKVPDRIPSKAITEEDPVEWAEGEFTYSANPKTLYKKEPLRPDFLFVEPYDTVIIMTAKGKLLRVTDDGKVNAVAGPPVTLPRSGTKPTSQPKEGGGVTFDAAGNRYQSDPKLIGIQKYDFRGTRKSPDITEGAVFRPTAIAVHRKAHLYVIDEGELKFIEASPNRTGLP